jgi:hypothetical protein
MLFLSGSVINKVEMAKEPHTSTKIPLQRRQVVILLLLLLLLLLKPPPSKGRKDEVFLTTKLVAAIEVKRSQSIFLLACSKKDILLLFTLAGVILLYFKEWRMVDILQGLSSFQPFSCSEQFRTCARSKDSTRIPSFLK